MPDNRLKTNRASCTQEITVDQLTDAQLPREQVRLARETLKCLRELTERVGTIEATAIKLANLLHDHQHGPPPRPVDRDTSNLEFHR